MNGVWEMCQGIQVVHGAAGESVWEIKSMQDAPTPDIVDTNDARYLHPKLLPFAQRHNLNITEEEVKNTIDVEISTHEQVLTAMMFEFEMESLAETNGAAATLALKFEALDLLRPVLSRFNAHMYISFYHDDRPRITNSKQQNKPP